MAGPFNWLSQVSAVTKFGLMGIPQRRGSVAAAVFGVAGVVGVLVGVLSMAVGFRKAMSASGSPDSAIVLRSGANSEMVSGFGVDETRVIADAPGLGRGTNGPLASAELFVIINLPKRSSGTDANVPLRGVQPAAFDVRDQFKIIQGRKFEQGKSEVIVGVGAAQEFLGLQVGNKVRVGRDEWPVVGVFSAGGGTAESEIWTDATVLQGAYHRGTSFQSVYAKLTSPGAFQPFKDALTTDPRLNVQVMRQTEYYAEQSSLLTTLITILGRLIATLMAVGAIFGALNTMYNSVSARTREIATLRALGFGRGAVVVSVMLESLAVALLGGVLGAAVAYLACNGFHTSTVNWQSFSQVTFAFAVTPQLLVQGIIWATCIGLIGGLLPAIRAARLPIAAALREL
ncbi:MAG TPA: FtsX-like permease family protein [Candidatus Acidoferrum sp.]|jgi:putative ABC transport system permease protein|nr:FtsX-like permease family protein [Candidatus Acidoferrum sp.]